MANVSTNSTTEAPSHKTGSDVTSKYSPDGATTELSTNHTQYTDIQSSKTTVTDHSDGVKKQSFTSSSSSTTYPSTVANSRTTKITKSSAYTAASSSLNNVSVTRIKTTVGEFGTSSRVGPGISITAGNTTVTDGNKSATSESSTTPTETDCLSVIGIASAISATIVVLVIVTCVICMLKTRRKWRKKLKEEKLKTDIWTMSTFNNTIINENFADYTLDTTPMPPRKKDATKSKRNSQKTPRSSISSRDLIQSWYSDGSRGTSVRRSTISEPNSIGKRKIRELRQTSEYSDEYQFGDGPYERGRTSTFSVGWNLISRDSNTLVNHEQPTDMSCDDFGNLPFDMVGPRNDHIVTEL